MKNFAKVLVFCLSLLVIAVPVSGFAQTTQPISDTITLSGVVPSRIYIVIDAKGEIKQIFSNSDSVVEPTVVRGHINGPETQITATISEKYAALKPSLDYKAGPGVIYKQPPLFKVANKPLKIGALANIKNQQINLLKSS